MTARELIKHIRRQGIGDSFYIKIPQSELIIKAIEKNIPKKPDYEAEGYADGVLAYDYAKCPVCEHEFEYNVNDWGCAFCQDCGQALDWGDE